MYIAFRQVDLPSVLEGILRVNVPIILVTIVIMILSVYIRAWRWQTILNPTEHYSVQKLYESAMIGYFGNSVLPFRMGELLRSYALSLHGKTGYSKIFGTIVLERVLDLLGLVVLIALFLPFFPVAEGFNPILIAISIATIVVFLIIVFFGNGIDNFMAMLGRLTLFQSNFGKKFINLVHQFVVGILSIRETRHTLLISFQTMFLWAIYFGYMWLCFVAVDIPMTWSGVGVVLIMTTLSISIPAAPGYIGTYHAVAVYTLVAMFSIQLTEAQTFAVVVHAIGYLPFIIVGSYYFFRNSLHFSDLKDREL